MSVSILSHFITGFTVGLITNPIDIVYTRQAADALIPKDARRNYTSFLKGINSVIKEGATGRGALSGGLAFGALMASLPHFYDYLKEYLFFFFGPTYWLRPTCLITTLLLGAVISLPIDNIKTRLHLMSALPDGRMPYKGDIDCFKKAIRYDCNYPKFGNITNLHSGFSAYILKNFISIMIGMKISDIAFRQNYKEGDFIELGNFYRTPYVKIIPHKPLNRNDSNKKILDMGPTTEFKAYWEGDSSFKV